MKEELHLCVHSDHTERMQYRQFERRIVRTQREEIVEGCRFGLEELWVIL